MDPGFLDRLVIFVEYSIQILDALCVAALMYVVEYVAIISLSTPLNKQISAKYEY